MEKMFNPMRHGCRIGLSSGGRREGTGKTRNVGGGLSCTTRALTRCLIAGGAVTFGYGRDARIQALAWLARNLLRTTRQWEMFP